MATIVKKYLEEDTITSTTPYSVSVNNEMVMGGAIGDDYISIDSGVTGVIVSSTIEDITLTGNFSDYRFEKGFGSNLSIYNSTNDLVMSLTDVDGKNLTFEDGDRALTYDADNNFIFGIDETAPTASVTAATITANDTISVESSEVGTAYLINTDVAVSNLSSITSADDNQFNSVVIESANTSTSISATGLTDGTYSLYAIDRDSNLSNASQFNVTVDTTKPTISAQNAYPNTKTLVLTISEDVTGTPSTSDFTVLMDDSANSVTAVVVSGTSVTLTLANTIQTGATLTVDYTQSTNGEISDAAGNTMDSVGDALSVSVDNDSVVPTVTAVTSTVNDASFGIGDVIPVTVTFSESVTVTGTPQLTLETGNTDRTVDYVSGTGSDTLTFNYTVQSGDTATDLDYKATTSLALNGGTIKDAAGNAATLTLAEVNATNSISDNQAIVVDGTLPTIDAQVADAGTKTITLTTSETATGTPNATDFTVLMNSVANVVTNAVVSGTTTTLTLTNAIQNSSTLTVDYAQDTAAKITDAAGNGIATVGDALSVTVTNDNTAPTVSAVASTASDGSYKVGDTIAVTVTFDDTVTVTGTPQLTLETGNTDRTVDYVSGTGSNTLTFNYTVQSGDTSDAVTNLDYKATTSLALNGGTIKDAAGNAATLTLAEVNATNSISDNQAIVVDGVVPTVVTVGGATDPSDGDKLGNTSSAFDDIILDFSEVIEVVSGVTLTNNISVTAPAGSTDQLVAFSASIVSGNLVIDLDENDADITGIDNQAIYINIDNNTLQDTAGNMVVGIDNSTDYNLYLSVIA